ncbi:MAG: hypothetical protein J6Q65_02295, partial [Lentisphaeria bacterium]|nr:hypothetical protein [Lentisphaeria bacterium]
MNLFGGDSRKTARLLFAAGSILLPLCCAGFLYLCVGKVHSAVTYFHAALAEQGAGIFFSGSFPALQLSVWKESFADQSLLFHLFLYLTQWLDSGIPHTGWIVLLLALFLSACLFAAKGLNLRMRTCFAGSLLLLFLSVPSFNA